jgi:hypothetical protein
MSSIKAMMVGNTMIAHINGKMYQKVVSSDEEKLSIYEMAMNTNEADKEEVAELLEIFERTKTDEEIQEEHKIKKEEKKAMGTASLLTWMEDVKENGDEHFEVKGIKLFMKGINITIPEFLAVDFCSRRDNEEDLNSLMNFWKLCALNKDPRCREDLYKFLMNHDMVVTPSGYFVAYRNVAIKTDENFNKKEGNKGLNDFVSKMYTKTKVQKKNVNNYDILILSDALLHNGREKYIRKSTGWFSAFMARDSDADYELVGNLGQLYENLSQVEEDTTTVYTDNHSKKMTIVIGQPVSIDRSECDADPDRTCSNGLHLGSPSFVTRGSFGQEGLICLCNPMNVVAVPYTGGEKLRCCEYLPVGVAEYSEKGRIIPLETATFEFEYATHTQKEIDKMLTTTRFESLVEHEIVPREISRATLEFIQRGLNKSLVEMNSVIASRVDKVN